MRRSLYVSLFGIVGVALLALVATFAAGNEPQLGLDLQGGASIVLKPKNADTPSDVLDQTISIIRNRVDALGVAEPEITRQGSAIVVELPGVKDQETALATVGKTAELQFRPVLAVYPGSDTLKAQNASTTTTVGGAGTTVGGAETTVAGSATTIAGATTTTAGSTTVASTATTTVAASTNAGATTVAGGPGKALAIPAQAADPTTTVPSTATTSATTVPTAPTAADGTATTLATGDTTVTTTPAVIAPAPATPTPDDSGLIALTPKGEATIDKQVVLAEFKDGKEIYRYVLGPTSLTGKAVSTASAQFDTTTSQWLTQVEFKGGQQGIDGFNELSIQCYDASSICPTRQTAIVLDGEVLSAPVPQARGFSGNTITISGGSTTAGEAKSLAVQLKYGSLPVEFIPQQVQTVSATLGKDSLRAGVVAGIVGLALVLVFMTLYYRTIGGLVILLGLCLSGSLMWSLVSFLGVNQGLALTLSGATGIIVSIGVTVDSYVVFFERLKDDVRSGKTLRSSVERGFTGAYRTIIAADSVSLLGAVVLWYLTVGSVRGFAFFLGLSTLLDMIVAYFFTRPFVIMLSRNGKFMRKNVFGVKLADVAVSTSGSATAPTRAAATSAVPPRPRGGAR